MSIMKTIYFSMLLSILDASFAELEDDMINEHNKYRAMHRCPHLVLDDDLSKKAVTAAKKYAAVHNFVGNPDSMGENTGYWTTDTVKLVKSWYDEEKDYDYDAAEFSKDARHFTQLIWKNSTMMGVGQAKHKEFTFTVVTYNPMGNIRGKFKENVPKIFKAQIKKKKKSHGGRPIGSILLSLTATAVSATLIK